MVPNALFRAHHFRRVVIPTFQYLRKAFVEKVLPGFDTVAEEANAVSSAAFEHFGQLPADDATHMGDLAEQAQEEGLEYYEGMTAARQSLQNLLAAAAYHLFEQQLLEFYRRELLGHSYAQDTDPKLLKSHLALNRLRDHGIDCRRFECWLVIDELRLVANTVKHGHGDSSKELRERRPEMFQNPLIRDHVKFRPPSSAAVYAPVAGEDFYVTIDDLERYFAGVLEFWAMLARELERQGTV